MSTQVERCYNCGRAGENLFRRLSMRWVCGGCGAWVVDLARGVELKLLYEKDYYHGDEYLNYELGKSVHKKNFNHKIEILKNLVADKNGVRLLEIGSATGEFLVAARAAGWLNSVGIEVSDFALKESLKAGVCAVSPVDKKLDEILKNLKPNLVVAWDVWEHLEKPSKLLDGYLDYASEDVVVALTTVDSESVNARIRQEKWRQFHPPTHINYPSRRSLAMFFADRGFEIHRHFYFGYYRPLAEYMAAVLGKKSFLKNSRILFRVPIRLNLFDTQMVVARRVSDV